MLDRSISPVHHPIKEIKLLRAESQILPNGISIHTMNANDVPVIKVEIILHTGSWYEIKPGDSYFSSMLLREGTHNKKAEEISSIFDQFGAFLEINPGFDFTSISVYCLKKYLGEILPILKEMLLEPSFDQEELERLKIKKEQQISLNNDKGSYLASQLFRKSIFGIDHPYGKTLTTKQVQTINRDDLVKFHSKYFQQPFDIFLSGDVSATCQERVNSIFQEVDIVANYSPQQFKVIPKISSLSKKKKDSLQSSIRIGKQLFTRTHPDYNKLLVVNEVLGGFFGSRLMKNIREEKGYTYGIYSSIISFQNQGYFVIGADIKREFTQQAVQEINKEINILADTLIDDNELEIVKNHLLGSFLNQINNPFDLMDKFKSIYFSGLEYNFYDTFIDSVNSISKQEIRDLSQKYFNPESLHSVIVGDI